MSTQKGRMVSLRDKVDITEAVEDPRFKSLVKELSKEDEKPKKKKGSK